MWDLMNFEFYFYCILFLVFLNFVHKYKGIQTTKPLLCCKPWYKKTAPFFRTLNPTERMQSSVSWIQLFSSFWIAWSRGRKCGFRLLKTFKTSLVELSNFIKALSSS